MALSSEPLLELTEEQKNLKAWNIGQLIREGGFDTFWAGRLAAGSPP